MNDPANGTPPPPPVAAGFLPTVPPPPPAQSAVPQAETSSSEVLVVAPDSIEAPTAAPSKQPSKLLLLCAGLGAAVLLMAFALTAVLLNGRSKVSSAEDDQPNAATISLVPDQREDRESAEEVEPTPQQKLREELGTIQEKKQSLQMQLDEMHRQRNTLKKNIENLVGEELIVHYTPFQTGAPAQLAFVAKSNAFVAAAYRVANSRTSAASHVAGPLLAYYFSSAVDAIPGDERARFNRASQAMKNGRRNGQAESPGPQDQEQQLRNTIRETSEANQQLIREIANLTRETEDLQAVLKTMQGFLTSDFVVIQPNTLTIGIRVLPDVGYRVVAKAEGYHAELADRLALRSGIRRVLGDSRLARQLHLNAKVDEEIPPKQLLKIAGYWKKVIYVPENLSEMIAFNDLREKRHRIAYYQNHNNSEVKIFSLVSNNEAVAKYRVETGTAFLGDGDDLLNLSPAVDYVDYALLRVAKELNSPDEATYHRVCINTVVDLSERNLERMSRLGGLGGGPSSTIESVLQALETFGNGRRDQREAFDAIRNSLEDEVYAKLRKLGIPVVERERLDAVLAEGRITGEQFSKIVYATHVLNIELGDAVKTGYMRYSVRLDDVYSGQVVWADTTERPFYRSAGAKDHRLASGDMIVINRTASKSKVPGQGLKARFYRGGNELMNSTVAFRERTQGQKGVLIRDLFGYSVQPLAASQINKETSGIVQGIHDIPQDNLMRYIVWATLDAATPRAGRVVKIDDGKVLVSIARAMKYFERGDRFAASRIETGSAAEYLQPLPVDLVATNLRSTGLELVFDNRGLNVLWSEDVRLQPGDVVYKRGQRRPLLAVEIPQVKEPTEKVWKKMRLRDRKLREKYVQRTKDSALQFAQTLEKALLALEVPVVDGKDADDVTRRGATHLIRTSITPASANTYNLELAVKKTLSQEPIRKFHVVVSDAQLNGWKP